MKKVLVVLFVALMGVYALPAKAYTVVEKDKGYIEFSTTETKEVSPDTVSIIFSVSTSDTNPKIAVEKNNQLSAILISSLKPLLALDKCDTIQTLNFELRPSYKTDKDGKSVLDNYMVKNIVKIKTKNISDISTIIDTAVKNNANNIDGISFSCENIDCYKTELTKAALVKLKVLAEETACCINEKVDGVKSVKVNIEQQDSNRPVLYKSFATEKTSIPIESGKININVSVDAEFYVK